MGMRVYRTLPRLTTSTYLPFHYRSFFTSPGRMGWTQTGADCASKRGRFTANYNVYLTVLCKHPAYTA